MCQLLIITGFYPRLYFERFHSKCVSYVHKQRKNNLLLDYISIVPLKLESLYITLFKIDDLLLS